MRLKPVCIAILCLLIAQPALGGPLRDFEQDATKETVTNAVTETISHRPHHYDHEPHSIGEFFAQILVEMVLYPVILGIGYGGTSSWQQAQGSSSEPREPGKPLIPFARLDAAYQDAESDVHAFDIGGELGYGPIAVQGRHTRFEENRSPDTLSLTKAHLLYRMSFGTHVECDLGLGGMVLTGADTNSGFSWTVPLLVHPSEHYGLEFRPAWATINGNTIQDYDLAMLLGGRFLSVKLGYRWLMTDHRSLQGPEAGIVLRW